MEGKDSSPQHLSRMFEICLQISRIPALSEHHQPDPTFSPALLIASICSKSKQNSVFCFQDVRWLGLKEGQQDSSLSLLGSGGRVPSLGSLSEQLWCQQQPLWHD